MRNVLLPTLLASALALAIFGPATATGQSGDASINDYQESVPGAGGGHGGDESAGGGGSGGGTESSSGSQGSALPAQTAEQLAGEGASGEALSDFTEETGPGAGGETGGTARDGGSDPGKGAATASDADDGSGIFGTIGDALSAVLTGSEEDTGLGVGFPLLLGAALIGTVALLVWRRRRG